VTCGVAVALHHRRSAAVDDDHHHDDDPVHENGLGES
jgi:hypothetical protein